MHRILTPAVLTSTPIAPNIIIIKAVGVLLGLILAIFSIFIYYAIYGKIRDVHSIESHSAIPIIAAIPRFNNNISKNRYFAMLLSQWRIKNLLTNHNTLTFTSFSYNEGATFVADAVAELLRKQRKKILTIHFITDTTHSNLYTFIPHNEGNAQLLFNILSDAFVSFEAIQEIINDIHLDFNHIVVYNTIVGDVHTMALMSTSDVNIFCVDTQKTPENKINHVDILAHDYSIPHLYFAINNIHYRRSIIAQCLYLIQGFVGKKSLS